MWKFSTVAGLAALAAAQRPSNMSICDYYTTALLTDNNATNQQTLLTLVVNTAVIGNYTTPNVGVAVPGILAPGTYNGSPVNLLPYFSGALASTNDRDNPGQAVSVNFLDGGGAAPLMNNMPSNSENSAQYFLLTHLYKYFAYLLGCSAYGNTTMAYDGSTSMYETHRFMALNSSEVGYFIQQVGLSAQSFGVADADVTAVGNALNAAFGYRCSPAASIPASASPELQAICIDDDCPLSPNATCSAYDAVVEPALANSTNAGGPNGTTNTNGTFTSGSPSATGGGSNTATGSSSGGGSTQTPASGAVQLFMSVPIVLLGAALASMLTINTCHYRCAKFVADPDGCVEVIDYLQITDDLVGVNVEVTSHGRHTKKCDYDDGKYSHITADITLLQCCCPHGLLSPIEQEMTTRSLHHLLLLSDSALPLGSFAFSSGLESFLAHNRHTNASLRLQAFDAFLTQSLRNVASTALAYVLAAHHDPTNLANLDNDFDASTPCTVARRASIAQGKALLQIWERALVPSSSSSLTQSGSPISAFASGVKTGVVDAHGLQLNAHFPPLFGAVCAALSVDAEDAAYLFLLNHAKAVLSAAVRASVMGPYQSQAVLASVQLQACIRSCIARDGARDVDDAVVTVPTMDLWMGRHEMLYSRIFNS